MNAAGLMQENFAAQIKKPAGGESPNPPAGHFSYETTLHSLHHDARRGEPATKPHRARFTIAKCILYPLFSLFSPKKCTFFRKMQDLACNTLLFIV